MATVTAVVGKLPWGQHSSDLQQRFYLKLGFLWSQKLFPEVSHLQEKKKKKPSHLEVKNVLS